MTNERKKNSPNLKAYHIIILACILSPLLIMNSKYVNSQRNQKKIYKEKSKLFEKILKSRKLEENEGAEEGAETVAKKEETDTPKTPSDKVCDKGHAELRAYYETGDLEKIGEKDDGIHCEDKDKDYLKALINIIKIAMGDDGDKSDGGDQVVKNDGNYNPENPETRNLLEIDSIKDDAINYLMHMLPIFIFFVIGILTLPAWPVCCFCCCCNCCCCCCCKKPGCKIPCFIFTYVFYALSVAICIYGLTQSNSIFVGIADTECSMLKFFDQVLEGEIKKELPRWAGIDGINEIIQDINDQIEQLRSGTLTELNTQIHNIDNKKTDFKNKMRDSGESFFTNPNVPSSSYKSYNTKSYYSYSFSSPSRTINGNYVLDLVKMFGRLKTGVEEEKYEPTNSILDIWHQEYKIVSENADNYLKDALDSFNTISSTSTGDVLESLKQGQDTLNDLKNTFNDIKVEIEGIFVDSSDTIDEYGKLGFKLIFGVLGLMNIALAVFVLFICLFSGKMCTNCCCCRCIFKFLTHLLWNILYLLMFITFIMGFLFGFIGTIGNDVMSIISFIVSSDNLGEGKENIIVDQLGEAKDYLDICINGNGSIIDLLNIDTSQMDSFNNITSIENQINETRKEFKEKKTFVTYSLYVDQLKARLNLSEMPILIKDSYDIQLPISDSANFGGNQDTFLKFDIELNLMNTHISTDSTYNEQWNINSNSQNECPAGANPTFTSPTEFNPLKCRPIDRTWINDVTTSNNIKNEAQIVSDTLELLDKAKNIGNSDSFLSILNDLKTVYNEYLDQYIKALDEFNEILHKITGKLRSYINDDDSIFSFINGKFIGLNLKVMLKYLKTALGKDVKTIGICLDIVGCSLALSISSTILLIVIINIAIDENKKKKKEEEDEEQRKNGPEYPQDRSGRVIRYNNY